MNRHLMIVQFMHPGKERIINLNHLERDGSPILNEWNKNSHTRKFLKANGSYVDSIEGITHTAIIEFWGEWEPQSYIYPLNDNPSFGFPHFVHKPFLQVPQKYNKEQNTDPYVFGNDFHYVCCQQLKGGHPTKLQYLSPGSIILFGSHLNGRFILDTLFVVSDKFFDINENNYQSLIDKGVSREYYNITIRPIFEQNSTVSCSCSPTKTTCCPSKSYRLYFGATFQKPYKGMYSFFPCLPFEDNYSLGFSRPIIDHKSINPALKMGWKQLITEQPHNEFWGDIAGQVLSKELFLGVFAEIHKINYINNE